MIAELLFYISGFCLLLGVVYPLFCVLAYPVYRWAGGRKSFLKYMRDI